MSKENIIQEFRLKNVDQTKNYFVGEIEENELMSRKYKMVCTTLGYTEHNYTEILASAITGCISISGFYLFDWCSYRNYKLYKSIKNLCNSCRN